MGRLIIGWLIALVLGGLISWPIAFAGAWTFDKFQDLSVVELALRLALNLLLWAVAVSIFALDRVSEMIWAFWPKQFVRYAPSGRRLLLASLIISLPVGLLIGLSYVSHPQIGGGAFPISVERFESTVFTIAFAQFFAFIPASVAAICLGLPVLWTLHKLRLKSLVSYGLGGIIGGLVASVLTIGLSLTTNAPNTLKSFLEVLAFWCLGGFCTIVFVWIRTQSGEIFRKIIETRLSMLN